MIGDARTPPALLAAAGFKVLLSLVSFFHVVSFKNSSLCIIDANPYDRNGTKFVYQNNL